MIWIYVILSGSCGYASSMKSFIYSLYNINGFSPVKLQIKSESQRYAIHRCSSNGPTFGNGYDIFLPDNAASNRHSYTKYGFTYHLPSGYSLWGSCCRFYAGGVSYLFNPTDIEVFYETTTQNKPPSIAVTLFDFWFTGACDALRC